MKILIASKNNISKFEVSFKESKDEKDQLAKRDRMKLVLLDLRENKFKGYKHLKEQKLFLKETIVLFDGNKLQEKNVDEIIN